MEIKNESELLNKFCDEFCGNTLLSAPFLNAEYNEVLSTDGTVLVGINPEVLTKEYPKRHCHLINLEFPCEKTITIEALNKAFDSCPMIDEEIVVEDAVECKECNGSGTVYLDYTAKNENIYKLSKECPICNGTGEIEPCKTKKTGKKIIEEDTVIEVGNAHIFANRLKLLKKAMEYFKVDSVKMTHNAPYGASEFIINKDVRVIIMAKIPDLSCECSAKLELIN